MRALFGLFANTIELTGRTEVHAIVLVDLWTFPYPPTFTI